MKNIFVNFLLILVTAAAVALAVRHFAPPAATAQGAPVNAAQSVYDHVIKTGTLRCGYVVYAPTVFKDPATGILTGIMIDVLNAVGKQLNLKVEWVEEVNYTNMVEELKAERVDAICANIWLLASRSRDVEYNLPLFYSGLGIWVRADDRRFDGDVRRIDTPDVRISAIDGDIANIIAADDFPKAAFTGLPNTADWTQIMLNIAGNKADVTFHEVWLGNDYLAKNPGTIRNIAADRPIRIYPNSTIVKAGEQRLKNMLDAAYGELLNHGVVDRIIDKYEKYPGSFYRVARPYAVYGK